MSGLHQFRSRPIGLALSGGIACVLPSEACRAMGADFIIGSDVWEVSSGYVPGPLAIERMISAGENATRLALNRFTAQAA